VTNAETLIVAGSHTLQIAVTEIIQLLHKPEALGRVTSEILDAFASKTDMDTKSLKQLPMVGAAIKEGMRLTSPIPSGLIRRVPDTEVIICGSYFPSGVSLLILLLYSIQ
jgi:cytochrome P450